MAAAKGYSAVETMADLRVLMKVESRVYCSVVSMAERKDLSVAAWRAIGWAEKMAAAKGYSAVVTMVG